MFGLPDAKRVRRSELYAHSQSTSPAPSEPDPELQAQFRARLASLYGLNSIPNPGSVVNIDSQALDGDDDTADEEPEQEFEFRLFSAAPGKSGHKEDRSAQKIKLVDEEGEIGDGGFVVRERNRGYYFAEKAGGERKRSFEVVALSGEEVLSRAKEKAWGMEVPWRVRVLKVAGKKVNNDGRVSVHAVIGGEEGGHDGKRKRPGKKRRIVLRERKNSNEKALTQKKAEAEKRVEAEQEKRTRRNREKKVKKKMKEKAKKLGSAIECNTGSSPIVGVGYEVSN